MLQSDFKYVFVVERLKYVLNRIEYVCTVFVRILFIKNERETWETKKKLT